MRALAVALPELPFELLPPADAQASAHESGRARALVIADPPLDERTLGGGTRLDRVNREAAREGVRPGHTFASARAKIPDLHLGVVRPAALVAAKRRLAEALLAFGATVALDAGLGDAEARATKKGAARERRAGEDFGDVVWVDVTGCAHLGLAPHERTGDAARDATAGEAALAAGVLARVRGLGHACRVALADGPWLAATWARSAPRSAGDALVVPAGRAAEAFASLGLDALPLDAGARSLLHGLGLRTVADLRELPRAALGARLGAAAADVLALAWGEDRHPLVPYVPEPSPEESLAFEHPVDDLAALAFVVPTLVDRLLARLEGRGLAVQTLALGVTLDRAPGERTRPRRVLAVRLPAPSTRRDELVPVVRARLERARHEGAAFERGVMGLSLRADELVTRSERSLPLQGAEIEARSAPALARVVGELEAELGGEVVGRLVVADELEPARRTRLEPFDVQRALAGRPARRDARVVGAALEPTRLFAEPRALRGLDGPVRRHVLRLEGVRWWAHGAPGGPGEDGGGAGEPVRVTDHVLAWHDRKPAFVAVERRPDDVHDPEAAERAAAAKARPLRILWLGLYD